MRLYTRFSFETLSNTYLIGPDEGGDAVLFDPSSFDVPLLDLIEAQGYYVRSVVLTHIDESHPSGLRTLRRIYDCTVYGSHADVLGSPAVNVADGDVLEICNEPVRAIAMPGHGSDSIAYYVDGFVFTGAAMSAGEHGPVPSPYAKELLLKNIRDRICTLPSETVILPFVGPPSTVAVEKRTFSSEPPPPIAGLP
ncbi:MAG: MBL fold metallo-hydrolase [Spirochaetota bacterium]